MLVLFKRVLNDYNSQSDFTNLTKQDIKKNILLK